MRKKLFYACIFLHIMSFFSYSLYRIGYERGKSETQAPIKQPQVLSVELYQATRTPTPQMIVPSSITGKTGVNSYENRFRWTGPDLWNSINKSRLNNNVEQLIVKEDLCTIASVRLNQLLNKGDLDGHSGFNNLSVERPDLYSIISRYKTVAEFLARGGETSDETVGLWENTMGHKKLLTSKEYLYGCVYAQDTYAVAIASY